MLIALLLSTALAAPGPEATPPADDLGSWDPTAAAASAGALLAADAATLVGGVLLIAATSPRQCEDICIDATAAMIALAGLAVVPPTIALLVANGVHRAPGGAERAFLAYFAQGAAIGLLVAAASTRSGSSGQTALLASAAALHVVGVPVALGFAAPRVAPGAERLPGTPTLGLSFRW